MDLVRDPLSPTRETFGGKKRKTALSLSLSWENKKTLFPSYQKSVLISLSRSLSLSLSRSRARYYRPVIDACRFHVCVFISLSRPFARKKKSLKP